MNRQLPLLFGAAAGALALAAGGTALVSRRLRRQTHGLGPAEMTRMYEHHDAVLHAVREGVLIVGGDGRLLLANDEARRLLDLPPDAEGRRVARPRAAGRAPPSCWPRAGRPPTRCTWRATGCWPSTSGPPQQTAGRPAASPRCGTPPSCARCPAGPRWRASGCGCCTTPGCGSAPPWTWCAPPRNWRRSRCPRFADFVTVDLLDPVLRGEEPSGASTEMRRTAILGIRDDQPLYPVGELIRFVRRQPMAHRRRPPAARCSSADLAASDGWQAQDPDAPGASWTTASTR